MRLSAPPLPVDEPAEPQTDPGLLTPLGVLYALPIQLWLVAGVVLVIGLGVLGWQLAGGPTALGGTRPDFADFSLSADYRHLTRLSDDAAWTIEYEQRPPTVFIGTVRFVEHWHDGSMPFMTHDVLVTTGDYADSQLVTTHVVDHHFTWVAAHQPSGTINLLHILPYSAAIYDQLLELEDWQVVRISGPEILRITRLDADGQPTSYWQDAGCNTTLVTFVEIQTP